MSLLCMIPSWSVPSCAKTLLFLKTYLVSFSFSKPNPLAFSISFSIPAPMIYHALCCSLHVIMQQFSMQDCILSNTTIHQPALLQVKMYRTSFTMETRYHIEPCKSFKYRYCKYWYLVLYHPSQTMLPGTWSEDLERNCVHSKSTFCIAKKKNQYITILKQIQGNLKLQQILLVGHVYIPVV